MATPPRRVCVSLTTSERSALRQLAERRREPEATTAARLIRAGLASDGTVLEEPPARRRGPAPDPSTDATRHDPRPAVAMLLERYPEDLEVRGDYARDRLVAERLGALALWREQLDAETSPDPRGELAFHAELVTVSRWLEDRGRDRR